MRIDIPDDKKLVFELRFPIRWGDMDAMGHVNNVAYFRYLETVRIEWMGSLGAGLDPNGETFVIVNAFCNFYTQLEYPGEVIAKLYIANPGRSSFDQYVTLERSDDPGKVYAAGGATTVWVANQKSMPLPDAVRELFQE